MCRRVHNGGPLSGTGDNRTKAANRGTRPVLQAKYAHHRTKPCRNSAPAQFTTMNTLNDHVTPPAETGRSRRRVLVLESDRLIRALIVEWLGMAGDEALGVADLTSARALAQPCDLVLVDVPAPHR